MRQIVSWATGLVLCAGVWAQTPAVVYENSTEFSGVSYETSAEFGDEVILSTTRPERAVTEIEIEYYAAFTPSGDEVGRVRFYSNTGPFYGTSQEWQMPANPPLFEGTFPVGQGYQTAVLTVPNVVVPDHFTWTVQFLGIAQNGSTERAGLLFYSTPTVGASYDDFWEFTSSGWAPLVQEGVTNNFAAKITAVTAPSQPRLTITKVGSSILITWPASNSNYQLESKSTLNAGTWTPVSTAPTLNSGRYEVALPISAGNQFFRLRST